MSFGGCDRVSPADGIVTLREIAGTEPHLTKHNAEVGDVRDTRTGMSRVAEAIGYAPKTQLRAGLAQECAWPEWKRKDARGLSWRESRNRD